eukprot:38545-Eustigmatos_ZCMA.PRE.1
MGWWGHVSQTSELQPLVALWSFIQAHQQLHLTPPTIVGWRGSQVRSSAASSPPIASLLWTTLLHPGSASFAGRRTLPVHVTRIGKGYGSSPHTATDELYVHRPLHAQTPIDSPGHRR